jgi:pimeloyl-ACP methyl ester carboxylesterase
MWGISGGGPHVLACAALMPDLVTAVASLASPAPYGADGLDWFDGMGEDNVEEFSLLLSDPAAARAKQEEDRLKFLATPAEDLANELKTLLSPTDAAVLTGELSAYLTFADQQGLAPGGQGYWDDGVAMTRPWGFDLAQISVPVLVQHGKQDRFVPFSHGCWLADRIPVVQTRLTDDDGHLTLLEDRVSDVHAWLAASLT